MHIEHIEIANFRKLERVRIDFSETTTLFVGANNSGKTSAMEALQNFLIDTDNFSINDLTLTHWTALNAAGAQWEAGAKKATDTDWNGVLPFIDLWLNVPAHELHYVQKLLPTIDWNGDKIGVRLRYEPKDVAALEQEYVSARQAAQSVATAGAGSGSGQNQNNFALWPRTLTDFLSRRLRPLFTVQTYLLDPLLLAVPLNGVAAPQKLPTGSEPLEGNPLERLIQIDRIGAQRGLGNSDSPSAGSREPDEDTLDVRTDRKLSSQLRRYYNSHLDPFDNPDPQDFLALAAVHGAQLAFGERLEESFKEALQELRNIGYPGVTDPRLRIVPNIKPIDGLRHASAVQYEVAAQLAAAQEGYRLPEDSNGLGYQNLVLITFELMRFRDRWMKRGKAGKTSSTQAAITPPLHLVLIEEPEAHLHAQVQQVFINQAYRVLRKHERLGTSTDLRTQLVLSTHSSYIAHEAEFAALRYFRRLPAAPVQGSVPVCSVINLSEVFGTNDQTERFVSRYLKATHCDLFFADGAVLVEGPAERILVPYFAQTQSQYEYLAHSYITWLEIGGSHAHRLKSLIQHLGLNTLIITDIDAKDGLNGKAVLPKRGAVQKTRNATLKTWIPGIEPIDALLDTFKLESNGSDYAVRVAYQQPIQVAFKSTMQSEALANTFEDALVYDNLDIFSSLQGDGLIAAFRKAIEESADLAQLAERMAEALKTGSKAELALDLLYSEEGEHLRVPTYIHNGLLWLQNRVQRRDMQVAAQAA